VLPSGGSISTTGGGKFFILIQIYKLVLVLPLSPYPYLSLLCLSMPWESTFVGQPLSYFFSQILFIWLITSMSYCHLDLVVAFFLSILFVGYSFFYLWHFVILVFFVALVTTLFVVSRYLIKDILLMLLSSSSHNLIQLLAICGSASHHLFGLTRRSRLHSMTTLKS
jgi:hypothetical protein